MLAFLLQFLYYNTVRLFLTGEMDLLNYILTLGKTYLWTCRCKEKKESLFYLLNKYQAEKYLFLKSNNIDFFREKKWRIFEELILLNT